MGHPGREIERVWVLRAAPVVPEELRGASTETWEIEQGYLAPAAAGETELARLGFPEGRLRRIVEPDGRERFFHTVKSGSGVVRTETERELTRAEFEGAWPRTEGRRLAKTRTRVRVGGDGGAGGLVWEIDVFRDLPLVMVEVELSDEHEAFTMPAWIASLVEKEVSHDARYRNAALAMGGMPVGGA
jgi:CYTH domain-containing protein